MGMSDTRLSRSVVSLAGTLAIMLAVLEVLFDWGTRIDLNVSVLYSLPLIVAAAARRRRLLWTLAFILICVTFAVYVAQAPAAAASSQTSYLVDRVLAATSLLLSVVILDAWLRLLEVRDAQGQAIRQQNARLEAINLELLAHKEEIFRKNEELEVHRREIEEISNRKTQMMASISHDVRAPIQAITLMAEVIRRNADKPDPGGKIQTLAKRLQASAISVAEFLSEVIDLASFDMGRIAINNCEFDLSELITQQCERVRPIAESKGLDLVGGPCDVRVCTDRVKLGRIIGNLVSNAIKFTDTGGVTIDYGVNQEGLPGIRVSDTGRGINSDDLQRIFSEFAQADRPQPGLESGWGLGLAISRRMARLLGGDIQVESQLEHGSVFTVCLPKSSLVVYEECAMDSLIDRPR
jgi:signal transduction histidine kinase